MTSVLSVVQQIRVNLSEPSRWAKGAWGYDANQSKVARENIDLACRRCLLGEVIFLCGLPPGKGLDCLGVEVLEVLQQEISADAAPSVGVDEFNDSCTHSELMAFLDRTIERLTSNSSAA